MKRVSLLPCLIASGCLLFALGAPAQQADKLTSGPGADLVQAKCTLCHDIGNITRIRQARDEWEDTVKVMITRGAPITAAEAAVIVEYLTKHYGK